jgi:hypothetical protein
MAVFVPNRNWDRAFNTPGGMVGRHLRVLGGATAVLAKTFVGVDTGRLRSSIKAGRVVRHPLGLQILVGSDVNHALVHHQGSRPHFITAKPGGALRIKRRGGVVYIDRVRHPGTKPNPYLTRALRIVIRGR